MIDTRKEMREKLEQAKVLMSSALVKASQAPEDEIADYLTLRLEEMFTAVEFWLAKEHQFRTKTGEYA